MFTFCETRWQVYRHCHRFHLGQWGGGISQSKLCAKSCPTLWDSLNHKSARLFCPWDFLGQNTGVGCHFLLRGIFPTQGSNLHLLRCWRIVYHWTIREDKARLGVRCMHSNVKGIDFYLMRLYKIYMSWISACEFANWENSRCSWGLEIQETPSEKMLTSWAGYPSRNVHKIHKAFHLPWYGSSGRLTSGYHGTPPCSPGPVRDCWAFLSFLYL